MSKQFTSIVQKRGLVTIPHEVRVALGLTPGDTILFVEDDHGYIITLASIVPQNRIKQASNQGEKNE